MSIPQPFLKLWRGHYQSSRAVRPCHQAAVALHVQMLLERQHGISSQLQHFPPQLTAHPRPQLVEEPKPEFVGRPGAACAVHEGKFGVVFHDQLFDEAKHFQDREDARFECAGVEERHPRRRFPKAILVANEGYLRGQDWAD